MLDVGSSELLLIVIAAVVFIGPKDLPRALYKLGQVIGKGRAMTRHFRAGIDEMIRQAELEELEKKWAADNARIMAQTTPQDGGEISGHAEGDGAILPAPVEEATHFRTDPGHPVVAAEPEPMPAFRVDPTQLAPAADAAPLPSSGEDVEQNRFKGDGAPA